MDTRQWERIRTWTRAGFRLSLWDTGWHTATGQRRLAYRLSDNGTVIFEGSDYGCAPAHAIDSDAAVAGILTFLSLGEHDTDADFFAHYTAAQLAWRDSDRRDELSLIRFDMEERTNRRRKRRR